MATEQTLLEMSKHFKDEIKKKNNTVSQLQKIVCLCYGLARTMVDHDGDISLLEPLRGYLSAALTEHCGVIEYEE